MNLIPSQKIYQLTSLDEYNLELQTCIKGLAKNYEQQSVIKKWELLLDKFKIISPENAEAFSKFQQARKNANTSLFNLNLNACLEYFQNFYFLYTTEDPRYKLSDAQKKLLLEAINDAMTTCETGINTRFELVLQQFRTDLDWVRNTLSKTRYLFLLRIQDAYNTEKSIRNSLRVHVLKVMHDLAIELNLGITVEHQINDAHEHAIDKTEIQKYFKQHYPKIFVNDYEEKIIEILSQDLLFQLQEQFCPNWATSIISIPMDRMDELRSFVNNRIALDGINILENIGNLSDDAQIFLMKSKDKVYDILYDLIKQKLVAEKFFIPFTEIRSDNPEAIKSLHLREGVTCALILNLNESFQNFSEENKDILNTLLQNNYDVILQYPGLLLTHISRHPGLLSIVPQSLQDNKLFLDECFKALNEGLYLATKENNEVLIKQFIERIDYIIENHSEYLTKLSQASLANIYIAATLIKRDWNLFKLLPDELKKNKELIGIALKQNPLALLYTSVEFQQSEESEEFYKIALSHEFFKDEVITTFDHNTYLNTIKSSYISLYNNLDDKFKAYIPEIIFDEVDKATIIANLQKMKAINQLLESKKLSLSVVANLAQSISPEILISIINERRDSKLSPLPFCPNTLVVKQFSKALRDNNLDNWTDGASALKNRARELYRTRVSENASYNNFVLASFVKHDSWYMSMLDYQLKTYFVNFNQFWLQLKDAAKRVFDLFWQLCILSIPISFTVGLLLTLPFAKIPLFIQICCILHPLGLAVVETLMLNEILKGCGVNFANTLLNLCSSVNTLLSGVLNSVFISIQNSNYFNHNNDLKTKCEDSIIRLRLIGTTDALQKAELLEQIFSKINAEIEADISSQLILPESYEEELNKRLNTMQDITYLGKLLHVSFQQIAAIRRVNDDEFIIPANQAASKLGFFKTTTTKILSTYKEKELEINYST